MAQFNESYRLKPNYNLIAHSPDIVELRAGVWNPTSITLFDRTASGKLFRTLELLDGTRSLAEICEEVGITRDDIESVISYLEHHNAIQKGPESIFDYRLELLKATLSPLEDSGDRQLGVQILGDPELSEKVADAIRDFVQEPLLARSSDALIRSLVEEDFTLSEDPLVQLEKLDRYKHWQNYFIVAVFEQINPIFFRNLNRLSLRHGFAWIHAALDGPFLFVGPTFIPRRSPCYECFEGRISLNIRESSSYLSYKKALTERKVKFGAFNVPRAIAGLLTSLTGFEALNYLSTGSAFTIRKVLALYLPTMEFGFHEFLRLPGCSACSAITEQNERSLYFDVKGFVNELYKGGD